jgi:hypothetical protein
MDEAEQTAAMYLYFITISTARVYSGGISSYLQPRPNDIIPYYYKK